MSFSTAYHAIYPIFFLIKRIQILGNLCDTSLQGEAWKNAFIKFLRQHIIKNPVMAITWLGTIITLVSTLLGKASLVFGLLLILILFVTVLFANYVEAGNMVDSDSTKVLVVVEIGNAVH